MWNPLKWWERLKISADQWVGSAQQIDRYFRHALVAYAMFNDEDAKVAAIAAAKYVSRNEREPMIAFASAVISELPGASFIQRVQEIQREISVKDWTMRDGVSGLDRLYERNPEYHQALKKADPEFFVRKYPLLFDLEDLARETAKEVLGPSATPERIESTAETFLATPIEATSIIGDYGDLLVKLGEERKGRPLHPLSMLPHPKEKIRHALEQALQVAKDEKMKKDLKGGLRVLEDFIPDDEIPEDPKEAAELWFRTLGGKVEDSGKKKSEMD